MSEQTDFEKLRDKYIASYAQSTSAARNLLACLQQLNILMASTSLHLSELGAAQMECGLVMRELMELESGQ